MKKQLLYVSVLCAGFFTQSQDLIGAWEGMIVQEGRQLRSVVIFSPQFQAVTIYDAETGAFESTNGGSWNIEGNTITETVEFDTENPERVGNTISFEIELSGNKLKIKDSSESWTRIDDGTPGELKGAWLISGRMRNGELVKRATDRPRKTMKILSGTRFQWIAYNTQSKEFLGTGGGTYTTVNGEYTENIEFFSRDLNRVGAELRFSYDIKEGAWHHSGNNSRGEPLYEIWSLREK